MSEILVHNDVAFIPPSALLAVDAGRDILVLMLDFSQSMRCGGAKLPAYVTTAYSAALSRLKDSRARCLVLGFSHDVHILHPGSGEWMMACTSTDSGARPWQFIMDDGSMASLVAPIASSVSPSDVIAKHPDLGLTYTPAAMETMHRAVAALARAAGAAPPRRVCVTIITDGEPVVQRNNRAVLWTSAETQALMKDVPPLPCPTTLTMLTLGAAISLTSAVPQARDLCAHWRHVTADAFLQTGVERAMSDTLRTPRIATRSLGPRAQQRPDMTTRAEFGCMFVGVSRGAHVLELDPDAGAWRELRLRPLVVSRAPSDAAGAGGAAAGAGAAAPATAAAAAAAAGAGSGAGAGAADASSADHGTGDSEVLSTLLAGRRVADVMSSAMTRMLASFNGREESGVATLRDEQRQLQELVALKPGSTGGSVTSTLPELASTALHLLTAYAEQASTPGERLRLISSIGVCTAWPWEDALTSELVTAEESPEQVAAIAELEARLEARVEAGTLDDERYSCMMQGGLADVGIAVRVRIDELSHADSITYGRSFQAIPACPRLVPVAQQLVGSSAFAQLRAQRRASQLGVLAAAAAVQTDRRETSRVSQRIARIHSDARGVRVEAVDATHVVPLLPTMEHAACAALRARADRAAALAVYGSAAMARQPFVHEAALMRIADDILSGVGAGEANAHDLRHLQDVLTTLAHLCAVKPELAALAQDARDRCGRRGSLPKSMAMRMGSVMALVAAGVRQGCVPPVDRGTLLWHWCVRTVGGRHMLTPAERDSPDTILTLCKHTLRFIAATMRAQPVMERPLQRAHGADGAAPTPGASDSAPAEDVLDAHWRELLHRPEEFSEVVEQLAQLVEPVPDVAGEADPTHRVARFALETWNNGTALRPGATVASIHTAWAAAARNTAAMRSAAQSLLEGVETTRAQLARVAADLAAAAVLAPASEPRSRGDDGVDARTGTADAAAESVASSSGASGSGSGSGLGGSGTGASPSNGDAILPATIDLAPCVSAPRSMRDLGLQVQRIVPADVVRDLSALMTHVAGSSPVLLRTSLGAPFAKDVCTISVTYAHVLFAVDNSLFTRALQALVEAFPGTRVKGEGSVHARILQALEARAAAQSALMTCIRGALVAASGAEQAEAEALIRKGVTPMAVRAALPGMFASERGDKIPHRASYFRREARRLAFCTSADKLAALKALHPSLDMAGSVARANVVARIAHANEPEVVVRDESFPVKPHRGRKQPEERGKWRGRPK